MDAIDRYRLRDELARSYCPRHLVRARWRAPIGELERTPKRHFEGTLSIFAHNRRTAHPPTVTKDDRAALVGFLTRPRVWNPNLADKRLVGHGRKLNCERPHNVCVESETLRDATTGRILPARGLSLAGLGDQAGFDQAGVAPA